MSDSIERTIRNVPKRGPAGWVIVKLSAIDGLTLTPLSDERKADAAREVFKAAPGTPARVHGDHAFVWLGEGEPDHEPEFDEPIVMPNKPGWALVTKAALDMKMPVGTVATELDYKKLALTHFDTDTIHVRVGPKDVAVWLHDDIDPDPESEPEWPVEA